MHAEAAAVLGKGDAEMILAMSHSCSHVRYAMGTGYSPDTQCGVCFGRLVPRFAFHASGMTNPPCRLN